MPQILIALFLMFFTVNGYSYKEHNLKTVDNKPIIQDKQTYELNSYEKKVARIISDFYNISLEESKKVVNTVYTYTKESNIDPYLIFGIIATESNFNRLAKSSTGAGYTQVYEKYHLNKIKGRDIYDTKVNINIGVSIFKDCINKHKNEYNALACYNGATTDLKKEEYVIKVFKNKNKLVEKIISS